MKRCFAMKHRWPVKCKWKISFEGRHIDAVPSSVLFHQRPSDRYNSQFNFHSLFWSFISTIASLDRDFSNRIIFLSGQISTVKVNYFFQFMLFRMDDPLRWPLCTGRDELHEVMDKMGFEIEIFTNLPHHSSFSSRSCSTECDNEQQNIMNTIVIIAHHSK